jgi:hypothetical protein
MKLIARPVMNRYRPDAPMATPSPFLRLPSFSSAEFGDALKGRRNAMTLSRIALAPTVQAILSKKSNGNAIFITFYLFYYFYSKKGRRYKTLSVKPMQP